MTWKKQLDPTERLNPYEIGVREYSRADMIEDDFNYDDSIMHTLQEAVDVHNFNYRPRDEFNQNEANRCKRLADPVLSLPEGADPHEPVLQLARAGTQGFGFQSVLSIDSARLITDKDKTDRMADWIKAIGRRHNRSVGMVLFIERTEDEKRPRLKQLRKSVGTLVVPRLIIDTTASPQGSAPITEKVVLSPAMIRTRAIDPGPGMDIL